MLFLANFRDFVALQKHCPEKRWGERLHVAGVKVRPEVKII